MGKLLFLLNGLRGTPGQRRAFEGSIVGELGQNFECERRRPAWRQAIPVSLIPNGYSSCLKVSPDGPT